MIMGMERKYGRHDHSWNHNGGTGSQGYVKIDFTINPPPAGTKVWQITDQPNSSPQN